MGKKPEITEDELGTRIHQVATAAIAERNPTLLLEAYGLGLSYGAINPELEDEILGFLPQERQPISTQLCIPELKECCLIDRISFVPPTVQEQVKSSLLSYDKQYNDYYHPHTIEGLKTGIESLTGHRMPTLPVDILSQIHNRMRRCHAPPLHSCFFSYLAPIESACFLRGISIESQGLVKRRTPSPLTFSAIVTRTMYKGHQYITEDCERENMTTPSINTSLAKSIIKTYNDNFAFLFSAPPKT